jgi:anti-anti-sigma regulatory factor
VVRLHGPLTADSADHVLDLLRVVRPAPAEVEIDLSDVTAIDRRGATVLVDAYVATVLRGRAFALSGPSTACSQSLRRFGVIDVVDVLDAGSTLMPPRPL